MYGVVLLVVSVAVAAAAMKDARLTSAPDRAAALRQVARTHKV
jgi:hypothetical protein